jgi:hypothetical protein
MLGAVMASALPVRRRLRRTLGGGGPHGDLGQVPGDVAGVGLMWHSPATNSTTVTTAPNRLCTDGIRARPAKPNRAGAMPEDVRPYRRLQRNHHSGIMSERANHRAGASLGSVGAAIDVTDPDSSVVVDALAPHRPLIAAGAPVTMLITVDVVTGRELFDSADAMATALGGW